MANVESPEALVKVVFEIPGAAAFEVPGVAALEVPGVAAFEVPGVAALEVPGVAAFEVPGAAAFEVAGAAAFEVSEAAAFEGPGVAALEVPGASALEVPEAAFEVPGAVAFEGPRAAGFEGSVTAEFDGLAAAFDGPAVVFDCMEAAFEGPAEIAAVFSCASLDRMPLSEWVAEAWNSVLSGGDVEGECWGVLKNTQNIRLFTMGLVLFFSRTASFVHSMRPKQGRYGTVPVKWVFIPVLVCSIIYDVYVFFIEILLQ